MKKLNKLITRESLSLLVLLVIDIILIINFSNGTIVLESVLSYIGFALVIIFVNGFIGYLIRFVYTDYNKN